MGSRRKKSAAPSNLEGYPRKAVECEDGKTGEERGRKYARFTTSPELAAYRVINGVEQNSGVDKGIDVPTLMGTLRDQAKAVNRGDLAQAEAMLMNQATALQSLFARLTEKAFLATQLPQFEGFMRMALRAQNQCRATLETLSTIKNPPVIYAKQANISQGHQQVNNGSAMPVTYAHAGENEIQQNELLAEMQHGTTVDPRATGTAIGNDPAMATVGEINRTMHGRG
ncbi:hypothetical protein [Nitrosovibrio sp. Nv6]|uniref:hypothetical protein n=1 Tax=Nitrosovibrio sp. Nv6 TaxID=1855340 RepID=UPI0008CF8208|nr:hypothetical protein [Nitrosovibrio sp. Nv6]SEO88597.1 hypothetical protein SAMN05216316_1366 [Nitrosovibrio sp. Nv6]